MASIRLWRDLKDVWAAYNELFERPVVDENASYELALSAREYSRTTRAAVDDKLNFTATLMRAGEVEAAQKLFAEFEEEVRCEEAALVERVNEVKAAQALRREGITRSRLARMVAVATLGAVLTAGSAIGMTLVRAVNGDAPAMSARVGLRSVPANDGGARVAARSGREKSRRVQLIPGVSAKMSPSQIRTYHQLTASGPVDSDQLAALLSEVGLPAPLVNQVSDALVAASDTVEQAVEEQQHALPAAREWRAAKKKAKEEAQAKEADAPAAPADEEPSPSPQPSPTSQDSEDDSDDEESTPTQDPNGDDGDDGEHLLPGGGPFSR